ncbi:MAG: hypothetical protein WCL14_10575 [Bacteroidota bacterium]
MTTIKPHTPAIVWIARVLTIVFAAFITMFAADAFSENNGFWQTVLALIMHLTPTFLVVVLLLLAWRYEWIGGIAFCALAVVYSIVAINRLHWIAIAIIGGTMLLMGVLYLVGWFQKKQTLVH